MNNTLIKICYLTLFLAKGSLYPFFSMLLINRHASLFLAGCAVNATSITRLAAPLIFFGFEQKQISPAQIFFKLQSAVFFCVALSLCMVGVFAFCESRPLLSTLCVAVIMASLSLVSFILDAATVSSSSSSSSSHDEVAAASDFGGSRLFGSVGWGISSSFQLLVLSLIRGSNTNKNSALCSGGPDAHSWFSVSQSPEYAATNLTATLLSCGVSSPLAVRVGSISIFVVSLVVFLAMWKLFLDMRTAQEPHDEQDRTAAAEETVEEDPSPPPETNNNSNNSSSSIVASVAHYSPVLLLALLYGICDTSLFTFLFPYLKKAPRNVNTVALSQFPLINTVSEIIVLLAATRIQHLFPSLEATHAFVFALWGVRLVFYSQLQSSSAWIFVVESLNGFCFAFALVLCVRGVVRISKLRGHRMEEELPAAMSLLTAFFYALASISVALVGGAVAQKFGVSSLYLGLACICAVVALKLLLF